MIDTRNWWMLPGLLLALAGPSHAADGPDDPPPLQGPVELLQEDDRGAAPPVTGPTHEAFVSPEGARSGRPVHLDQAPPPPIAEQPRGDRPGPGAQWIGGYWAWDLARGEYVWAAGAWRVPPPGKLWVNGQWRRDDKGWYRVPGSWSARQTDRVNWREAGPPTDRPAEKVGAPPGPEYFFVPGQYVPDGDGLVWRAGFWAKGQAGWDWVPARWVRLATGWAYREGHWEHALDDRGLPPDSVSPFRNRVLVSEPREGAAAGAADPPRSRRTVARPPLSPPETAENADLVPPSEGDATSSARPADSDPATAKSEADPETGTEGNPEDRPAASPSQSPGPYAAPPPGPDPYYRRPVRRAPLRGIMADPVGSSRAILGLGGHRSSRLRVHAQLPELGLQPFGLALGLLGGVHGEPGLLPRLLGLAPGLLGLAPGLLGLTFGEFAALMEFEERGESAAVRPVKFQPLGPQLEPDAQPGTDPAGHRGDFDELIALAEIAGQGEMIGVVDVVFLDPVALVELEFAEHLREAVARGEDFDDHLGGDPAFLPLFVRAPIALGAAEGDQRIRGNGDVRLALDRIPEQIPGDEDIRPVGEQGIKVPLKRHDPLELERIFRHRLPVAVRVDDFGGDRPASSDAHRRPSTIPVLRLDWATGVQPTLRAGNRPGPFTHGRENRPATFFQFTQAAGPDRAVRASRASVTTRGSRSGRSRSRGA
jgi:hypothetical protein